MVSRPNIHTPREPYIPTSMQQVKQLFHVDLSIFHWVFVFTRGGKEGMQSWTVRVNEGWTIGNGDS